GGGPGRGGRGCCAPGWGGRPPAGRPRGAQFRDRLGIGRKRSIQILEHFDRIGLTRRIGNDRRLREGSALAEQLLGGVSP
ncbi:SelB domain-containing protein, partial [Pseudomonas aeruginosa]|uniref:SelB domain-containing protein n=1 Tax=Pseudomonas aeruginosa TaxID=287 RepID=UPI0020B14B45